MTIKKVLFYLTALICFSMILSCKSLDSFVAELNEITKTSLEKTNKKSAETATEKSNEKSIIGFKLPLSEGMYDLSEYINEEDKTITVTIGQEGGMVWPLMPSIEFIGEKVSPDPNIPQDFSRPVTYTITAEDSTTLNYTVKIEAPSAGLDYTLTNDQYEYNQNGNQYAVGKKGDDSLEVLNIPMIWNGKKVTSIKSQAFASLSTLKQVSIPEGIVNIGDAAFSECTNLTTISLPNSVIEMGDSTFSRCTNLLSITLPKNITHIGDTAFDGCYNLTSITIPEKVTKIELGAFWQCLKLKDIYMLMLTPPETDKYWTFELAEGSTLHVRKNSTGFIGADFWDTPPTAFYNTIADLE